MKTNLQLLDTNLLNIRYTNTCYSNKAKLLNIVYLALKVLLRYLIPDVSQRGRVEGLRSSTEGSPLGRCLGWESKAFWEQGTGVCGTAYSAQQSAIGGVGTPREEVPATQETSRRPQCSCRHPGSTCPVASNSRVQAVLLSIPATSHANGVGKGIQKARNRKLLGRDRTPHAPLRKKHPRPCPARRPPPPASRPSAWRCWGTNWTRPTMGCRAHRRQLSRSAPSETIRAEMQPTESEDGRPKKEWPAPAPSTSWVCHAGFVCFSARR